MLHFTTAVAMLAVFVAQPQAAHAQRARTGQPVTGVAIDPTGATSARPARQVQLSARFKV